MAKILLDTSVIVDYLRRKDKERTILHLLAQDGNELYISIITHAECYAGKSIWESKDARNALEVFLSGLKILSLEEKISEKAGGIKAKYSTEIPDAVIAATAISHKLKLATLNTKDFEKIKGIKLLTVESNPLSAAD